MKQIILAIILVMFGASSFAVQTKKVCTTQANGKQTCKVIKTHKKLAATPVPTKKAN